MDFGGLFCPYCGGFWAMRGVLAALQGVYTAVFYFSPAKYPLEAVGSFIPLLLLSSDSTESIYNFPYMR